MDYIEKILSNAACKPHTFANRTSVSDSDINDINHITDTISHVDHVDNNNNNNSISHVNTNNDNDNDNDHTMQRDMITFWNSLRDEHKQIASDSAFARTIVRNEYIFSEYMRRDCSSPIYRVTFICDDDSSDENDDRNVIIDQNKYIEEFSDINYTNFNLTKDLDDIDKKIKELEKDIEFIFVKDDNVA